MRPHMLLFLGLIGLLCGCAHDQFTQGHGDVGQFIVQQSVLRGGAPIRTNALPEVSGAWRYSEDENGVIVLLPKNSYPAIEAFLRDAFGKPAFGPTDTTDGCKLGEYRFQPRGGGIQFTYDAKNTQVIVLRPLYKSEAR